MPKWYYWGMSRFFFIVAVGTSLMQFIDGFPWGYVGLSFAVAAHYYLANFKRLNTAPEE